MRTTFHLKFSGFTLLQHIPISSHELLSLPKVRAGSGDVTGLKFENRTRTQSRTQSNLKLPNN